MLQSALSHEKTDHKYSKSIIVQDLNDHHAPTNKLVIHECNKFRKGASMAGNKLFYWYSLNKKKGIYHTDFFLKNFSEEMQCSTRTAERWIKELCTQGLFILEKIRYSNNRVQYRMKPTDKFIRIKACGTAKVQNEEIPQCNSSVRQNVEKHNIYNIKNNTVLTKVESGETFVSHDSENNSSIDNEMEDRNHFQNERIPKNKPYNSTIPLPVGKACSMIFRELCENANISFSGINWISFEKACERLIRSHFGSVAIWRKYLESIFSNEYLMGKKEHPDGSKFILRVETILSSKLADMFIEKSGYFKVWKEKIADTQEAMFALNEGAGKLTMEMVEEEHQGQPFANVYTALFDFLGERDYTSWIKNSGFVVDGGDSGELVFKCKAKFYYDYIMSNFKEVIERAFLIS